MSRISLDFNDAGAKITIKCFRVGTQKMDKNGNKKQTYNFFAL